MRLRVALLLAVVCFALPLLAQDRSLHWSSLDVEAKLSADGLLHIDEKQTIVFNGEWNGGERKFDTRPGQSLRLISFEEIEPETGSPTPFREGELSYTETFAWHSANVLRWRARATNDPPFTNTTKVYLIRYTLTNAVMKRGDRYRLSHDFAFRDREGVIEQFTLDFTLDPVWQPLEQFEMPVVLTSLQPGSSYVLRIPMQYTGSGTPAATEVEGQVPGGMGSSRLARVAGVSTPPVVQKAFAGIVLLVIAGQLIWFLKGEMNRGRFAPFPPDHSVDRAWLEEHILRTKAEVIGAAWDEKVNGREVAALIARLSVEGYISTGIERRVRMMFPRNVLTMKKLKDFEDLPDHERWLLEALFVGKDETDTDRVREMYKDVGFDPVAGLREELERQRPWPSEPDRNKAATGEWLWFGAAVAVSVGAMILYAIASEPDDAAALLPIVLGSGVFFPFLVKLASSSRRNVGWSFFGLLKWMLPLAWALDLLFARVFLIEGIHPVTLILLSAFTVIMMRLVLRYASTAGGQERIAERKKLIAARRFFKRELREKSPKLEDEWFPYLLAFGLERHVERWFKVSGVSGLAAGGGGSSSSSAFGQTAGYSTRGWTGGGGAFGGAGASGSWSSAAGGMAAVISAPSSSSSGGGSSSSSSGGSSSGGSSSSGGGGGGGW